MPPRNREHGDQEGRAYNGYYRDHCFLPLYVFCGDQLLVSYLRPSNLDGAKHTGGILSLLVRRFRQQWPEVRVIVRGDSGLGRQSIIKWCERHDVGFILGIARNDRIPVQAQCLLDESRRRFQETGEKQRLFDEFQYAARKWNRERRIIVKAEHLVKGANPEPSGPIWKGRHNRFMMRCTVHGARWKTESLEQQRDMFADRTRCHRWWPNQFRMLLSSMGYVLLENLRRLILVGTELATAYVGTIRLKLLRIGAGIVRNTRRVRLMLSSHYPYPDLFRLVVARLVPG